MSDFEQYAALARQLSQRRRSGERDAAADAERRAKARADADQLGRRLTLQEQRLRQLGQAAGQPAPVLVPVPPAAAPVPVPGGPAGQPAYPEPAPGTARLALPTTATPSVPGGPARTDPAVEVDRARQAIDASDAAAHLAERLAQRPPLLPGWSPLARAVAVYGACALVTVVPMIALQIGAGLGAVDAFTLYAWLCAGLPGFAFIAGYLILGRWGVPALRADGQSRYLPLGFGICFTLLPIIYCGYILVLRALNG